MTTTPDLRDPYEEKLKVVARDCFNDNVGRSDYEFTSWEQQYDEMIKLYREGSLSKQYIDFAFGG